MPQPTQSDLHINAALTSVSVAYIQSEDHFIASRAFPQVVVQKQADAYWEYTKGDWFRNEARVRADGTESAGDGYDVSSTNSYFCRVKAIHKDIGNQARANADAAFNLEVDATRFVTQRLLLAQEIDWATSYFSTGVWDNETSSTAAWSDYTNGDPIGDVEAGKQTILGITGFEPNTLILGYSAFRALKHHPDVIARFTGAGNPMDDPLVAYANIVGVERILVAKAITNTANEAAADSFSFTQTGGQALLCYSAPSAGLLQPSAGYSFTWQGVSAGLGANVGISRIDMPHLKATRIEGEIAVDFRTIATDLGVFFDNASTF